MIRTVHGDCRDVLGTLAGESVQCVVTSPPYFGLRSYLPDGHPDKVREIGLEKTPEDYVATMVAVFREVWRVLRKDGSVWLNLGDSYARTGGTDRQVSKSAQCGSTRSVLLSQGDRTSKAPEGFKDKDLFGIPWMVAFALRADGWYLRSAIVWEKPNPMPESSRDRPTSSYEMVFLLTKRAQYFYDGDAIREPMAAASLERLSQDLDAQAGSVRANAYGKTNGPMKAVAKGNSKTFRGGGAYVAGRTFDNSAQVPRDSHGNTPNPTSDRNSRNVWRIATQGFKESHFATMPTELAERCILAGTSAHGCCSACGAPYVRVVEKGKPDIEQQRACGGDAAGQYHGASTKGHVLAGVQDASAVKARILAGMVEKHTTGWAAACGCQGAKVVPCTVLDPFAGAGTTGMVADRLGRNAIMIDLHPSYVAMQERRIVADAGMFAQVVAQ